MNKVILIAAAVAAVALSFSGTALAGARNGSWAVEACPTMPRLEIPCRFTVEKNYGQALIEARYLNANGWAARVVQY